MIDAYADGALKRDEFNPRIKLARKRLSDFEVQLAKLHNETREQATLREALSCLDRFSETISSNLDDADWTTKREILRTLIARVAIQPEQVRVVYRVNFPLFVNQASEDSDSTNQKVLHFCWRGDHAALWRSSVGIADATVFFHSSLQPFVNQAQQHTVAHPKPEERSQMIVVQMIKELPDVHF